MKKNIILCVIAICCLMLNSCIIIPNFTGFNSGYNKLSEQDKSLIKITDKPINELKNKDTIYSITGKQINEFIQEEKNVLVYLWSPNCHGNNCYSIKAIDNYCKKENIKLIIVAEYYCIKEIKQEYTIDLENVFFLINYNYYKTNYCNKYVKLFTKDMLYGMNYSDSILYKRFFLFSNAKLIETQINI
jgi:hypothetical protein